ncbi:MAG TPA: group 1 truncated hemoglobin [Kofleriaceae bacterium]|nr:group 1 truncated hemoglobin [Kofleriaceae bacterium]
MRIAGLALAFALALGGTACGGKKAEVKQPAPQASLYDRLGQKPAIEAVVDKFLANVSADTRINAKFATIDADEMAHFRQMLIDQVCEATGGPCKYTGKSMKEAHAGMGITDDEFNALVEDLKKALDDAGAKPEDRDQLLTALGGMKGDIVGQ